VAKLGPLPDSAGKAYLFMDIARVQLATGNPKASLTSLASARKSVEAMTDDFWKVRAHAAIGKLASGQSSSLAAVPARAQNEEGAQAASEEQVKAAERMKQKVGAWTNLIDSNLNGPLFTDLQGYIQSLKAKPKAEEMFDGISGAVGVMAGMLGRIKQIEKGN
jgi:hypothetical protein